MTSPYKRAEVLLFEQHGCAVSSDNIAQLKSYFNVFACSRLEHATEELQRRSVDLILVSAEHLSDSVVEQCKALDESSYGVRRIVLMLPESALEQKLDSLDFILGVFPFEKTNSLAFINQLKVCAQIANQQHALKIGSNNSPARKNHRHLSDVSSSTTETFNSDLVLFSELVQRTDQGTAILICIKEQASLVELFGNETPDLLTNTLRQRISRSLRQTDCLLAMPNQNGALLRIAPLELLLPVQKKPSDELLIIEQRITELLEKPVNINELQVPIDFKLGKSNWDSAEQTPNQIVQSARNNAVFWTESATQAKQSHDLESDLFDALANDEFELVYQPVYALSDNPRIVGVEALLRWHRRHEEWVPPDIFIPIAEKIGLIKVIGRWVIEEVAKQQKHWRKNEAEYLPVAINISAEQLGDNDFLPHLKRTFENAEIPANAVELEITESCLIANPDETIRLLSRVKALGFSLALDDFGTGYSSLSYLRNLPLDVLKIDRTFISSLDGNQYDPALPAGIVGLGLAMGLRIIAEGIETPQHWQLLKDWGCHEGQGFLMSRPVKANEITKLLDSTPDFLLEKAS